MVKEVHHYHYLQTKTWFRTFCNSSNYLQTNVHFCFPNLGFSSQIMKRITEIWKKNLLEHYTSILDKYGQRGLLSYFLYIILSIICKPKSIFVPYIRESQKIEFWCGNNKTNKQNSENKPPRVLNKYPPWQILVMEVFCNSLNNLQTRINFCFPN